MFFFFAIPVYMLAQISAHTAQLVASLPVRQLQPEKYPLLSYKWGVKTHFSDQVNAPNYNKTRLRGHKPPRVYHALLTEDNGYKFRSSEVLSTDKHIGL